MKTVSSKRQVKLAGRDSGLSAYFEKSGIRYGKKMTHTPFLVFRENTDEVAVEIVDNAVDLLGYPTNTKVMSQWAGSERSDYMAFTVGQLRKHVKENPKRVAEVI